MFKLKDITKIYQNGVKALNCVSLDLPNKGFVTLLGKSGSGKSTLLNILSGMDNYTSGVMSYNGIAIESNDNATKINSDFAFIHQDYKIIENLSVMDNMAISCELSGRKAIAAEILDVLKSVELDEKTSKEKVKFLSGGQKQRVAIARAIYKNSKVIFADEPTGNLDSENSDKIFQILKVLSKEKLVILVTHDSESAEQYSDIIVKIMDGEIVKVDCKNENIKQYYAPMDCEIADSNKKCSSGKLSFKQTCALGGWSLSYKPIRLIISTILAILLATVCCFSISFSFMSKPQVFENDFPKGENRYIHINNSINIARDKITALENELKVKTAKIYRPQFVLDEFFYDYQNPNNFKPSKQTLSLYYSQNINFAIIADDLNVIGTTLIEGRLPIKSNELLISKTFADKLILQKFIGKIHTSDGAIPRVELNSYNDIFSNQLILEKSVIGTGFSTEKIVGIFDDRNEVDEKFKNIYSDDIDLKDNEIREFEKLSDNILITSIIRPSSYFNFSKDTFFLSSGINVLNFNFNNNEQYLVGRLKVSMSDKSLSLNAMSDSQEVADYFEISKANLEKGKIAISKREAISYGIENGSAIKIELNVCLGDTVVKTKILELEVSQILDVNYNLLLMSELDYANLTYDSVENINMLAFNSQGLEIKKTAESIERIINPVEESSRTLYYNAFGTDNVMNWYDNNFNTIYETISIIMIIITVSILLIFMYIIISVNIDSKSKDWMVLRAEGASYKHVLGILLFQHLWVVLAQIIAGTVFAAIVCLLFNSAIMPLVAGFGTYFFLRLPEILITISLIIVSAIAMISLCTIKLFRKKIAYAININK